MSLPLLPLGFAIVGHLVWRVVAERHGDLIQQHHDARIMVAVLLGGMLSIDLAAETLFGFAWRPLAFAMAQNAMILAFGLWLAGKLLTVRTGMLSFRVSGGQSLPAKIAPPQGSQRNGEPHHRLSVLMDEERVLLDPHLTFAAFVERIGAPERTVRTLINHELGYDHFRTFLNHYRVGEARRLLGDRYRADKLVTVALDSGVASLASFYRPFARSSGMRRERIGRPPSGPTRRQAIGSRRVLRSEMPAFDEARCRSEANTPSVA